MAPPPPSPSRPRSPWGQLDPYDSSEDDKEYVGFATLPNQVHRKSVKKGFDFTLMVAGESGLGKSTLVNSLFLTDMYRDRKLLNAEERITQTVEITKHAVDIEEKGVKLKLTIVDTPGFGDAVNNTECWKPVADYIDQQFEQYFRDESGLNRKNIQDNRVHCCIYFISPFGHGLRPLDVEFMRALHQRVNIVPVLAKADTLTPTEVERMKNKIREEIDHYGIRIYQFPECDSDEDEEFKQQDQALKVRWAEPHRVGAPCPGGELELRKPCYTSLMLDIPWRSCWCHLQLGGKGWDGDGNGDGDRNGDRKTHAVMLPPHRQSSRVSVLEMDVEMQVEGCGPQQQGQDLHLFYDHPLAGEHPLRCHRQQHGGGSQGTAHPWAALPLGHRGR
uniref:Septin 4 n=1 Tax=Coturnix japonica TaxID=93934 RepID=A0A8C2SXV5_COTJA